jgi:hypothetical protein
MTGLLLKYLAYFGPDRRPAALAFSPGLNVICGASETGKSFVVESIDFMLGQQNPVRDIPERDRYDRARLVIESAGWPPLTLDRSIEGGHFRAYEEVVTDGAPTTEPKNLRWQHSAARQDTLSFALLGRAGLTSKVVRKSTTDTRSLSFRDLVRLCVVTEEEIQRRGSPLLSGQFTTATAEYAAFKLLLTGTDDSALVSVKETTGRRDQETGKIELLNQMIEELQVDLDEEGADEAELNAQLERLEGSIKDQNAALTGVQKALDSLLERRGAAASELRNRRARVVEIEELVGRFSLLDSHYETDLNRLKAIHESGSLFVHLEQKPCPLCGASPGDQHLDADCEGNTAAVVQAADAEMSKINRLRRELEETVVSLKTEREQVESSLAEYRTEYSAKKNSQKSLHLPYRRREHLTTNSYPSVPKSVRLWIKLAGSNAL